MQVLLGVNMLYALILPVVEVFVGAYIMRNTNNPAMVALYQLAMYVGIILTSVFNGVLLKFIKVNILYTIGILLSAISMVVMMSLSSLDLIQLCVAGCAMGAASGFFWTNRYLLSLNVTEDDNRNYYFGLESFAFTIANHRSTSWSRLTHSRSFGTHNIGYRVRRQPLLPRCNHHHFMCCHHLPATYSRLGKFENPHQKGFLYIKFHTSVV